MQTQIYDHNKIHSQTFVYFSMKVGRRTTGYACTQPKRAECDGLPEAVRRLNRPQVQKQLFRS